MKHHPHRIQTRNLRQAMSLIELLVVISIIGVLAGLLLPAVGNVKKKARVVQAQKDMADMKGAINVYQHDYSRLPASAAATAAAATYNGDYTYGSTTASTGYGSGTTNIYNRNNSGHQASNAELMLILTAATSFPNYTTNAAANQNDSRNPRKIGYFNAKSSGASGATAGKGLGTDGVMRDPWGNPYIIALDLNYDNWVSNSVYNNDSVNGFNTGLARQGGAGTHTWALRDTVMIFSFGGDGFLADGVVANVDPNKDNVLSWK